MRLSIASKFCGFERDVHRADRALMHGQRSANRQRRTVTVENPEFADGDDVRLEVDAGIQAAVARAQLGNRKRAAVHLDRAIGMRVVPGSRDVHVRLERSRHVGDVGREPLNEAEADRAARNLDVDDAARPASSSCGSRPGGVG